MSGKISALARSKPWSQKPVTSTNTVPEGSSLQEHSANSHFSTRSMDAGRNAAATKTSSFLRTTVDSQHSPIANNEGSDFPARWWHMMADGRIQCDLCPRECHLKDRQRGFCFVRQRVGDRMVLGTYGRSSGFAIDPVEKKPLNHFLPGTAVLSFGTAGCNLACKFCQNWDISKARQWDRLAQKASPQRIASAAADAGCASVAFTYNDPMIFPEYAIDVADVCHARGIKTIAVTAGYINPEPRNEFFSHMDAANIDLKAFTDHFYRTVTGGRLQTILDTISYVVNETDCWVELTTLLIPGLNDSVHEVSALSRWIASECGPDVPLHFSAFHPDWRMRDVPPTPLATLVQARQLAMDQGLRFVYTGNVHNREGDTTWCPTCKQALIKRDWYAIGRYNVTSEGACSHCGTPIPGVWGQNLGTWGPGSVPVRL